MKWSMKSIEDLVNFYYKIPIPYEIHMEHTRDCKVLFFSLNAPTLSLSYADPDLKNSSLSPYLWKLMCA